MDARPGGPAAKREPSPEGLGLNSEDDSSAVGAALTLVPLAPVSLVAQPRDLRCPPALNRLSVNDGFRKGLGFGPYVNT
jgi:hypothetical protein